MSTENENAASGENEDAKPVVAAEVAENQKTETLVDEPKGEEAESTDEAAKSQDEPVTPDPEKEKAKSKTREFIDSLKTKAKDADKRAKAAEAELAKLKAEKPKRDDFEDEHDYQDAREDWREADRRKRELEAQKAGANDELNEARVSAWQTRLEASKETIADIAEVISDPKLSISPTMAHLIMDSERGPEIAYALAKNQPLAREICAMSDLEAAKAIGRLEADASPKPRKTSNAPAPVDTVGAGKGSAPGPDLDKMPYSEYRKHMGFDT